MAQQSNYQEGYEEGWRSVIRHTNPPPPPPHAPPTDRMLYDAGYARGRSDAIAYRSKATKAARSVTTDNLLPGESVPRSGSYEELNVCGSPTGRVTHAEKGERLPASALGFTWRRAPPTSVNYPAR